MEQASETLQAFDVVVVGGGVSGLYTAWRLLTEAGPDGPRPTVAVFERSRRLGGRLLSVTPPGVPDTRLELGGMRFTSAQERVSALVDHLKLRKDLFPVYEPENIAYLRGKLLRRQDLFDPDAIPYNLAPDERDADVLRGGFTVLAAERVIRTILGKNVPFEKALWNRIAEEKTYEGKELWDVPLQYALRRSISQEAFRFAEDSSGYDTILHTWSVADGLPWNLDDFGKSPQFYHLHRGFDALPDALAGEVKAKGGEIALQHRLDGFEVSGTGEPWIDLRFEVPDPERGEGLRTRHVRAGRLVLAMPRRALELLRSDVVPGPKGGPVRGLIESVVPIPLFKLALCYSYPWWTTVDAAPVRQEGGGVRPTRITVGQSITDIPLRQCYYWATDPETQNSVLLIYDDGTDLSFWAALRGSENAKFTPKAVPADAHGGSKEWDSHEAPALMVAEAHRQLLIMHGVTGRVDIPKPYAAAYRDWSEDPYGGGVNFWRLGARSHDVAARILQPVGDKPVYVCGEAYSHFQGWVEGALETADAMLERHFGIPPLTPSSPP